MGKCWQYFKTVIRFFLWIISQTCINCSFSGCVKFATQISYLLNLKVRYSNPHYVMKWNWPEFRQRWTPPCFFDLRLASIRIGATEGSPNNQTFSKILFRTIYANLFEQILVSLRQTIGRQKFLKRKNILKN